MYMHTSQCTYICTHVHCFPCVAMADAGTGMGPRDAAVIEAILREMGVEDFEPNVIHQMLEFSYS